MGGSRRSGVFRTLVIAAFAVTPLTTMLTSAHSAPVPDASADGPKEPEHVRPWGPERIRRTAQNPDAVAIGLDISQDLFASGAGRTAVIVHVDRQELAAPAASLAGRYGPVLFAAAPIQESVLAEVDRVVRAGACDTQRITLVGFQGADLQTAAAQVRARGQCAVEVTARTPIGVGLESAQIRSPAHRVPWLLVVDEKVSVGDRTAAAAFSAASGVPLLVTGEILEPGVSQLIRRERPERVYLVGVSEEAAQAVAVAGQLSDARSVVRLGRENPIAVDLARRAWPVVVPRGLLVAHLAMGHAGAALAPLSASRGMVLLPMSDEDDLGGASVVLAERQFRFAGLAGPVPAGVEQQVAEALGREPVLPLPGSVQHPPAPDRATIRDRVVYLDYGLPTNDGRCLYAAQLLSEEPIGGWVFREIAVDLHSCRRVVEHGQIPVEPLASVSGAESQALVVPHRVFSHSMINEPARLYDNEIPPTSEVVTAVRYTPDLLGGCKLSSYWAGQARRKLILPPLTIWTEIRYTPDELLSCSRIWSKVHALFENEFFIFGASPGFCVDIPPFRGTPQGYHWPTYNESWVNEFGIPQDRFDNNTTRNGRCTEYLYIEDRMYTGTQPAGPNPT